jgi:hypothetical protein
MAKESSLLSNLFDIKKIIPVCILLVLFTICSVVLTTFGTSVKFLGVEITHDQVIQKMLEE